MILLLSARAAAEYLPLVDPEDLTLAFGLFLELVEAEGRAAFERGLVAV